MWTGSSRRQEILWLRGKDRVTGRVRRAAETSTRRHTWLAQLLESWLRANLATSFMLKPPLFRNIPSPPMWSAHYVHLMAEFGPGHICCLGFFCPTSFYSSDTKNKNKAQTSVYDRAAGGVMLEGGIRIKQTNNRA